MTEHGGARVDGTNSHEDLVSPATEQPTRPTRRAWVVGVLAALTLLAAGATLRVMTSGRAPALSGDALHPPARAYDFRLPDQDGHYVTLSELRGKVVVLTFLYTHCPNYCPVIADTLHRTYATLGTVRPHVVFMAVSVDPRGDTPAAVREFLAKHGVQGELEYLTGSFAQLRPIWKHYWVAGVADESSQLATHTTVVYVIDRSGMMREFFGWQFAPRDLASDVRVLTAWTSEHDLRVFGGREASHAVSGARLGPGEIIDSGAARWLRGEQARGRAGTPITPSQTAIAATSGRWARGHDSRVDHQADS